MSKKARTSAYDALDDALDLMADVKDARNNVKVAQAQLRQAIILEKEATSRRIAAEIYLLKQRAQFSDQQAQAVIIVEKAKIACDLELQCSDVSDDEDDYSDDEEDDNN